MAGNTPISPLLAILGGLTQGAQGYQQGREQKQDRAAAQQAQQQAFAQQKAQMEQQKFAADQMKRNDGMKQVQEILDQGRNSPAFRASPGFKQRLSAIQQQFGLNLPTEVDDKGVPQIDVDALIQKPGTDIDTYTPDQRENLLQFPPEQRKLVAGPSYSSSGGQKATDAFFSAPVVPKPLTQGRDIEIQKEIQKNTERLEQNLMTPGEFKQFITSIIPETHAAGYSGLHVEGYLDPNGDFMKGVITRSVTAQIARYEAMGISIKDKDALAKGLAAEHKREFDLNYKQKGDIARARLDLQAQGQALRAQTASASAGNVARRLDMDQQRLGLARDSFYWRQQYQLSGGLKDAAGAAEKQLADARALASQYTARNQPVPEALMKQIDPNYGIDPDDPNATPPDNLATRAGRLQDYVIQAKSAMGQTGAQTVQGITQHKTQSDNPRYNVSGSTGGGSSNVIHAKSKSGKPIVSNDGGKSWSYE